MRRSRFGVKLQDRIPNKKLHFKTRNTDVGKKAARLKLDWASHVSLMDSDRWAKVSLQWELADGRCRRGRPRKPKIVWAGSKWPRVDNHEMRCNSSTHQSIDQYQKRLYGGAGLVSNGHDPPSSPDWAGVHEIPASYKKSIANHGAICGMPLSSSGKQ